MKIITGDKALRQCIPNTFATVEGEVTWFNKLYPYLEQAEQWLAINITSQEVIDSLYQVEETDHMKRLAAKIITCQALMGAIPSLDLVLTPNGFGIVNTGNVVPASKDRVERLIASVESERDYAIEEMIVRLGKIPSWVESRQGIKFKSTLYPNLDLCRKMGKKQHIFEEYLELVAKLTIIEATLAEKYFSEELMERFRTEIISQDVIVNLVHRIVIRRIRNIELLLLAEKEVRQQTFFDIVEMIKRHPETFPEWHESKTAKLYSPQVFKNEKESTGYWF